MRYEGVVDIFQTVKMLRTQRPAMVQTEVRGHTDTLARKQICMTSCNLKVIVWGKLQMYEKKKTATTTLFFPLQDEYQFCYHAALEYLGSFDHYAT